MNVLVLLCGSVLGSAVKASIAANKLAKAEEKKERAAVEREARKKDQIAQTKKDQPEESNKSVGEKFFATPTMPAEGTTFTEEEGQDPEREANSAFNSEEQQANLEV